MSIRVCVASILHSHTAGASELTASGETLAQIVDDLEEQYPGLKSRIVDEQDRIRRHICFFVDSDLAQVLEHPVASSQTVHILAALSGG